MQENDKPIMLWHLGYFDYPHNGIASYKNQKVWFELSSKGQLLNLQNHNECKSLDSYYYDIDEQSEEDENNAIEIWGYPLYQLYEIPDEYLKQYEYIHQLFQKFVGYHTDHDPLIYKPFDIPNWSTECKNNKFYNTHHPPINYNPKNYQCLGEFRSCDFVNYFRPLFVKEKMA